MRRDPLAVLLRIRKMAIDNERRNFSAHLARQDVAEQNLAEALRCLTQEENAATRLSSEDAAAEAYAAWLPFGRAQRDHAEGALARAAAETACARAALAAARAAAEVVQTLIDEQRQLALTRQMQVDQAQIDEIGQQNHVRAERNPFG